MEIRKFVTVVLMVLLSVMFFSCLDDNDSTSLFLDQPAVVRYDGDMPMLDTYYGVFVAPTLKDKVENGAYLLANFTVSADYQFNEQYVTVSDLSYQQVRGDSVRFKGGDMADLYTESMDKVALMAPFGETLFFEIEQEASSGQNYNYELICNPDSVVIDQNRSVQTLFICSSKSVGPCSSNTNKTTAFAFDISEFITTYLEPGENKIYFNLKYKSGTDEQGKDVFKGFVSNPISYRVRK